MLKADESILEEALEYKLIEAEKRYDEGRKAGLEEGEEMLDKLREERAGQHYLVIESKSDPTWNTCKCGAVSRCPTARALDVAIAAAEVHKPFGIYEECGHDHDEQEIDGDSGVIVVEALDKPYTCNEGLLYRVCEACHTDSGEVREDTGAGLWPCPTYKRMEAAYQGTARRIGDQGEE